MLRRDAGKSVSICDGFRKRCFLQMGRGFLPLLAVMFLAAPQLAFAQGSVAATVDPRSLEITEPASGSASAIYSIVLDAQPSDTVMVMVVDASDKLDVSPTMLTFIAEACAEGSNSPADCWNRKQEVTVSVDQDDDAVSETVTLTHTATVGEDDVTVSKLFGDGHDYGYESRPGCDGEYGDPGGRGGGA